MVLRFQTMACLEPKGLCCLWDPESDSMAGTGLLVGFQRVLCLSGFLDKKLVARFHGDQEIPVSEVLACSPDSGYLNMPKQGQLGYALLGLDEMPEDTEPVLLLQDELALKTHGAKGPMEHFYYPDQGGPLQRDRIALSLQGGSLTFAFFQDTSRGLSGRGPVFDRNRGFMGWTVRVWGSRHEVLRPEVLFNDLYQNHREQLLWLFENPACYPHDPLTLALPPDTIVLVSKDCPWTKQLEYQLVSGSLKALYLEKHGYLTLGERFLFLEDLAKMFPKNPMAFHGFDKGLDRIPETLTNNRVLYWFHEVPEGPDPDLKRFFDKNRGLERVLVEPE